METYQDLEQKAAEQKLSDEFDSIFHKLNRIEKHLDILHDAILFLCGSLENRVKEDEVVYDAQVVETTK